MNPYNYKKKITVEDVLKFINTSEEELNKLELGGQILFDIYEDFVKKQDELQRVAEMISNTLMKSNKVHSVRHRVKDPVHLLKKIIRKKENTNRVISASNYLEEVTDLIGVRALHLYKEMWSVIGAHISETWDLKEQPIAYIREGDTQYYIDQFEKNNCLVKKHGAGYRSVHYIIETKPNKQKYFAEIQVRTLFEEGWSEIDHNIRYPNNTDNDLINNFLQTLNRLSGSADELATYTKRLYCELGEAERKNKLALKERDDKIEDLQKSINALSIEQPAKEELNIKVSEIFKTQVKFPVPVDLSLFNVNPIASTLAQVAVGNEALSASIKGFEAIGKALEGQKTVDKILNVNKVKALKENGTGINIKSRKSNSSSKSKDN